MEQANTAAGSTGTRQSVMERVRSTATTQLSTQKDRATDGLGSFAHAVRQTTQPLRDNQQDQLAQYVEKAADQIERFSNQLRDRDVTQLMSDAEQLARRRPAVFIGAAFAAGLVAARFLKSSGNATRDGHEYADDYPSTYGGVSVATNDTTDTSARSSGDVYGATNR